MTTPRIGMFATVRNRRGVTTGIEPYDGPTGRLHVVHIEYKDDQLRRDEKLIWELEPASRLLEPTALPNVGASDPMPAEDFDALLRATRWAAATPFIDPDKSGSLGRNPVASPFHGAVQVDDFQLVPLHKALRMPRVSLLLADDVGLGKTVEAGLILTELLLRRRVHRMLILTPAALRLQWRDEMRNKSSLGFDLVDRDETHALRRRLPAAWRLSHGHHARVAPAPVGNFTERSCGAGGKWGDALGVEGDKEKLVAQPEPEVLQHRGVKMRPQPVDRALTRLLEVPSGSLPAFGEVWRHFVHRDLVHRNPPIGGRASGSPC